MSHCAVCCNPNKQCVPSGCKVPVLTESGNAIACGETQTLDIIAQMKEEFESKMQKIDAEAGGDCVSGLQAKLHLQQEWIRSLTVQNEMLVEAVKDLETEATRKTAKSEQKLGNTVEVSSERLGYLRSDIKNLLELIKRARNEGQWNLDGLEFYDVTYEDLFGLCGWKVRDEGTAFNMEKIQRKVNIPLDIVNGKFMVNKYNALTADLAEKEKNILSLRQDNQKIEEHCRQTNQQCQFKDETIKVLRKQLKLLHEEVPLQQKLQTLSVKAPETIILHNCCPYVKDFCPLYTNPNVSSLPPTVNSDNLKSTLKIQVPSVVHKNMFSYDDQTPTHDNLNLSKSVKIRPQPPYEKARSLSSVDCNLSNQKTKLSARNILNECYDHQKIKGLGVTTKNAKKINITIPNHVSVKTFVNNLECSTLYKADGGKSKIDFSSN